MFLFESVHNRRSSNFQLSLSLYFLCSWCILSLLFLKKHSNIFLPFLPIFWALKPNLTKYKIAGLGALKGVEQTVYGMKFIDWGNKTFEILSALFSYNETLRNRKNMFNIITGTESVLKWETLHLKGNVLCLQVSCCPK